MRWTYLLIAASVLVLDQMTKALVVARITPERVVPVVPGFLRLGLRAKSRKVGHENLMSLSLQQTFH